MTNLNATNTFRSIVFNTDEVVYNEMAIMDDTDWAILPGLLCYFAR